MVYDPKTGKTTTGTGTVRGMSYSPKPAFGAPVVEPKFSVRDPIKKDPKWDTYARFKSERFPTKPSLRGGGGGGRIRGKKLWEYGSRFAHSPRSAFTGLQTGYGTRRPKRLRDYRLGWQSPSARTGRPTLGGLSYSANIRNPIGLDVARSRAMAGREQPEFTMPGVGGGFGPQQTIGYGSSITDALRFMR